MRKRIYNFVLSLISVFLTADACTLPPGFVDPPGIDDDYVTAVYNGPPVPDGYAHPAGSGNCYYIHPQNGSDAQPGTFSQPWRTTANINTSLPQNEPPGHVDLAPGDVVYLMEGVYNTVFTGFDSYYNQAAITLQNVHGAPAAPITIRNYPGRHAVIDPQWRGTGIRLLFCSNIRIQGLEIRRSYSRGLLVRESENITADHLVISRTDGPVADNVAGVEFCYTNNAALSESFIYNNYDRNAARRGAQTENSSNMVLFNNQGSVSVHDNLFFQTQEYTGPYSGGGIKYKHGSSDPNSTFELYGNYFENHKYFGIGIGTHHAHVHHNIVYQPASGLSPNPADAVDSRDWGGPTHQQYQVFEYNTIYAERAFFLYPTLAYRNADNGPWDDLTHNAFRHNIVYAAYADGGPYPHDPPMEIYTAISDTLYTALLTGIEYDDNCYFNPARPMRFGYAEDIFFGVLGGNYDLSEWSVTYGWDATSNESDPGLADPAGGNFIPGPANAAKGALESGYIIKTEKIFHIPGIDP